MNSDKNMKSTTDTIENTKITIKGQQYYKSDGLLFLIAKHINCNCLIAYFYKIFKIF